MKVKRAFNIFLIFIGLPVTLVLAWYAVQHGNIGDRMILYPSIAPENPHGAEQLKIPFGSGQLEVWRANSSPRKPEAFVLRFYGNADRPERWITNEAAAWAGRSIEFWGVNYPGYGASTGPARLQAIADAALAAYDAAHAKAPDRPIFAFGTSLGSAAALHLAAERPVAGLLLQNPPALPELIVGQHGWWNLWLIAKPIARQVRASLDSVGNAARVKCPAVFLLADQDEVVAHKYHQMVVDAYAGPKQVLIQHGAGHNTPPSKQFSQKAHVAVDHMFKVGLAK